jgi:hypothetical protein
MRGPKVFAATPARASPQQQIREMKVVTEQLSQCFGWNLGSKLFRQHPLADE